MTRRILSVALTATAFLLLALPAQAKVAGKAFISGPGGGSGTAGSGGSGDSFVVDGSDGAGWPVVSGLLDPSTVQAARPDADLGPRYRVRYVIDDPPGQPVIVQDLYPFAEAGPVVYTPPGQVWMGSGTGQTKGGWHSGDPDLASLLRGAGMDIPEPGRAATVSVGRTPQAPAPSPARVLIPAAVILTAVAAAVIARRRRVLAA